uniref:Uncharacterized protein n=1 Tax=Picea glauca TaxID=3330 RepID=A0A101LU46_PICGL|nr:hypothetical protein ABT39_MTgene2672 [Picea glauca]
MDQSMLREGMVGLPSHPLRASSKAIGARFYLTVKLQRGWSSRSKKLRQTRVL